MKLEKWQWKRLIGIWLAIVVVGGGFLIYTCNYLYQSRVHSTVDYNEIFTPSEKAVGQIDTCSVDAVKVTTGTYLENFRELNINANNYRVVFKTWFK